MEDYKFIMQGPAFENGDRLDKVAAGLIGLQHFFDGSFKAMTNKSRLTKFDREQYQIKIQRYEDGSFLATLGAIYSGIQTPLPLAYAFTPKELWEYTKTSYEFLKHIFNLAQKGEEFSINQEGEGNIAVVSGDTTNNFYGPVYQISTQIINPLRDLDDLLEEGQVDRIGLGQNSTKDINLELTNKGLFLSPTTVDESPVELTCDIYDFNKYENQGKARISNGEALPEGNYKFRNIGGQPIDDFILSMTETNIKINCLVKYEHDPLTEKKISELLIVDIAA